MPDFNLQIENVKAIFPQFKSIIEYKKGGQKIVYKVISKLGDVSILKLIKSTGNVVEQRAIREINAAMKLKGSNFVKVFDANYCSIDKDKYIYILEEYIEGEPLSNLLKSGKQSIGLVKNVGDSLLKALSQIDSIGLVHRDIKPDNIIVNSQRIVLIDLGIARHIGITSITNDFAFFGPMTVGYCAPEQILNRKRAISIKTDIFAIGIVLYEMLTGKNPFIDDSLTEREIINKCIKFYPDSLLKLGFSESLSDFVSMCMEKEPNRRHPNIKAAITSFNSIDWR